MDPEFNDDVDVIETDTPDTSDTPDTDNQDDNFSDMQDRMSGEIEPWFSDSVGRVVDGNGNPLKDDSGNEFTSLEDYQNSITEKPEKNEEPEKVSFQQAIEPSKFQELANVGKDFKYSDELLPKITQSDTRNNQVPPKAELEPLTQVKAMRKTWNTIAVDPIKTIAQGMVQELVRQGADQTISESIVNNVITPILSKQSEMVDNLYRDEYEKAIEKQFTTKHSDIENQNSIRELKASSDSNTDLLSKKYFGDGGKNSFFSIINGYTDKDKFVRGQASHVMDYFENILNKGKVYKSQDEVNKSMANTYTELTSDPTKAGIFFDLIYHYWLGKNAQPAQKLSFQKGKEAEKNNNTRIKKTVRQRPASIQNGQPDMFEGMPKVIKAALMHNM